MKNKMRKIISTLLVLILMLSMTIIGKEDVKAESPGDDFAATAWEYITAQESRAWHQDQFLKDVYYENGYFLSDLYPMNGKVMSYEDARPGDLVFMNIEGEKAVGILVYGKNGDEYKSVIFVPPGKTWLEVHSIKPTVEYYKYIVEIKNYF